LIPFISFALLERGAALPKYCAFDIEIVKAIPGSLDDWKVYRPLSISCAATLNIDGELRLWHGQTPDGEIADQLSQAGAVELVAYLQKQVDAGFAILTWNGLGFDFDILAEESGRLEECQKLALWHVDMMFHLFCAKGYTLALDKAAKGMGLPGKTPGMTGEMAPPYWAEGKRQEVLQYVGQDVRTTLDLATITEMRHALNWISGTGKPQALSLPRGWLRVQEALALPEPDTSWQRNPLKLSKFIGWIKREK
jgi:hypothetical protein